MKPERKEVAMTDDEKTLFNYLHVDEELLEFDLNDIKSELEISNKKWDKLTKTLKTKGLIEIYSIDNIIKIKAAQ